MKQFLFIFLALVMLLSVMPVSTYAAGNDTVVFSQNHNVSDVCPWERITTYGVNPPTVGWDIRINGAYSFSGTASYSRLYLSKLIYGADHYSVDVTNRSSSRELIMTPHDTTVLTDVEIPAGETKKDIRFTMQSGKTYFCLSFAAPSDFEGVVTEWIYQ